MSRDWPIAGVLFLLALALNLSAVEHSPFHPDETRWLNRAHYLTDLADPFGPTWEDGYLTRGQPPLASYLMGAGLLLQGRDLKTNGVWDFHYETAWNERQGNMASPADLAAGRRANAVIGGLAAACFYLAARHLTHRAGAVSGAVLLATHPLTIMLSSQALSDALLVLWLALALLAGGRLTRQPGWGRAVVLAVALGLGGATKLSPLLISVPLAALGAVLLLKGAPVVRALPIRLARRGSAATDKAGVPSGPLKSALTTESPVRDSGRGGLNQSRSDPPDRTLGWCLLAMPVLTFLVFVAVYPYLWLDPVGRTAALFAFRAEEMERQGANWVGVAVDTRAEALVRIGERLTGDYSGVGTVASWLRGADLAIGLAGLLVLTALALRRPRDRRHSLALMILGAQAALIVIGLRSDYARYHLPLVLVICAGVAVAVGQLWTTLAPHVHRLGERCWGWLRSSPAMPRLGWGVAGAGVVLAMLGVGSAQGDDLPEIVALPGTPVSRATPGAGGTPLASPAGATPVPGAPVGTPGTGPPAASPRASAATPAGGGE